MDLPKDIYEWSNFLNRKDAIEPADIQAIVDWVKSQEKESFHNPLNAQRAQRIRAALRGN